MRLRTAFLSLARERIVISEITITPQTEHTTADQVSRSGSKRYRRMSSSIPAHSRAASREKIKRFHQKGRRNFAQTEEAKRIVASVQSAVIGRDSPKNQL